MSAQEVVPLAISALALGISVYGIFERRNAAYAALRVRITELLDRLAALGVDEQEYRYAHADVPYDEIRNVVGSIQSRRLVPTYQAIALLERLRSAARLPFSPPVRLTPQEHMAIAESLSILRDLEPARAQCEEAVIAAGDATPLVRATVYHGYGRLLFALGEVADGRAAYRTAIENYPDTETGRWAIHRTPSQSGSTRMACACRCRHCRRATVASCSFSWRGWAGPTWTTPRRGLPWNRIHATS